MGVKQQVLTRGQNGHLFFLFSELPEETIDEKLVAVPALRGHRGIARATHCRQRMCVLAVVYAIYLLVRMIFHLTSQSPRG